MTSTQRLDLAIALIRRTDDGRTRWLVRDVPEENRLKFIIARRLEDESPRETIAREVAWQWGMDREKDFLVSSVAQLNVEFEGVMPGETDPASIHVAFFNVSVYRASVLEYLDQHPQARWIDSQAIHQGRDDSGAEVDPVVTLLNQKYRVIEQWESDHPREW